MTDKPETAVLPMDPQPVYLIAGQSAPEQPGLSIVDALVWAYRRRWWLMIWFAVFMGAQLAMMLGAKQEQCLFTIRAERGSLEAVVVALQEDLARRGDTVRDSNPQIEFQKLGTGTKSEQTRSLVLVQVTASTNESAPRLLDGLRQVAQTACGRAGDEYLKQANLTLEVANERMRALRADSNATIAERSAAEMSVASASVAAQTPLVLVVSEIERHPVASGYAKRFALATLLSGTASILLVGVGAGFGELRRRAAQL